MPVCALHHYTIRCAPQELPPLLDFYTRVLRLQVGPRPDIPAPGAWLYAEGQPIVHLYAHLAAADASRGTGPLDHVSFRSRGLREMRAHLAAQGVAFSEAPIPGWDIHQLFLHDPHGLKIEMTFWLADEEGAEAAGAARHEGGAA
jgi:catechol 2,3-dioxygenase-like lactoylglutathione lyase family enzyme